MGELDQKTYVEGEGKRAKDRRLEDESIRKWTQQRKSKNRRGCVLEAKGEERVSTVSDDMWRSPTGTLLGPWEIPDSGDYLGHSC